MKIVIMFFFISLVYGNLQKNKDMLFSPNNINKLEISCQKNDYKACGLLGIAYNEGKGVAQDYQKAIDLYAVSCEHNDFDSCVNLGVLYERGEFVKKDRSIAIKWYKKGCKETKQFNLSCHFLRNAQKKNIIFDQAMIEQHSRSCKNGNYKDCLELADEYRLVKKNYLEAIPLYYDACFGKEDIVAAAACSKLASLYYYGKHVKKDVFKAKLLQKRACKMYSGHKCDEFRVLKEEK